MSMEDLLRAMMGSVGQPSRPGSGSGDPLADMLQGILGNDTAPQKGGGLEEILGAIMGSAASGRQAEAPGASGGLLDILSAVLGSSMGEGAQDIGMTSIIESVASKLGLSEGIAQLIVAFVIGKLLGGMGSVGGGRPATSVAQSPTSARSFNLDSLLDEMGRNPSMAEELAQQTGLDAQTAQQGMRQVLEMLGGQAHGREDGRPTPPQRGSLDDLLKNW